MLCDHVNNKACYVLSDVYSTSLNQAPISILHMSLICQLQGRAWSSRKINFVSEIEVSISLLFCIRQFDATKNCQPILKV